MILMLILVAVAAFYGLILPFRCATFALPVLAGLGLAFTLRNLGRLDGHSAGLLAGISADALGRHSARGPAPFAVRFAVILMFAGAAASAGYHAGLRSRCLPTSILGRSARLPSWLPSSPLMPVGAVSCRPGVGSSDRRCAARRSPAFPHSSLPGRPAPHPSAGPAPSRPLDMRHLSSGRFADPAWCNRAVRLSSPGVPPFLAKQERRTARSSASLRASGCTAGPR